MIGNQRLSKLVGTTIYGQDRKLGPNCIHKSPQSSNFSTVNANVSTEDGHSNATDFGPLPYPHEDPNFGTTLRKLLTTETFGFGLTANSNEIEGIDLAQYIGHETQPE